MTENTFFDNWAGRSVDFATAGTPSKWILTELLSEKNSQVHGDDFFKNGCIGGAYGTFLCHNVTDSTQRGVMKVLMQVPWEGSQYAPAEHRFSQASGSYELDWNITSQLNALITLTSNNCLSTPRILDLKYGWQETADPVPGGYIIFILMSYLPGVQLTKAFWGLEDSMHYIQYGIGCLLSLLLTGAKGHEDKLFTRGPAFSAYPYPTFFIECPEIGASGSRMDIAHVYDGSGYFPELRWPITTPDTQEYVLVCEDPDELLAAPVIHGIYYGIPPVFIGLHRSDFIEVDSRNDPYRLRGGFKYGANSGGGVYLAPQPARGQGPHRYFFELIALNHTIDQSKLSPMATFDEIARQIEGKIIGWAVLRFLMNQVHARDYYNGTIGGAYATFLCHNFVDSTQRGVMKIFKQVPFEGSENATIQQRGAQASQELDYFITSQLRALNTLTQISPTR
ncbi:phosphatidylethanolamine-binding protein [Aspergillus flavus]|uniref:Phosphatidylethanolamine-binding protein n=1 Tax=Aspergillus flavus TaxID=5059 RepID=A0A5N6H9M1_ASPFL|nr:phosphatidylethanolamine-binding protein [Aspergillus flavus]